MQPHLGDVPDGLEPKRLPYRSAYVIEEIGWIEWLKHTFLAWVASIIFAAVVGFILALLFLFAASPSLAHDERQIRRDCRADALRHCKPAIYTLDRNTIIQCMVAHRDKLSAACARHLWKEKE